MKSSITKSMNEQETKELTAEFVSCHRLRSRLIDMLNEEINIIYSNMLKEDIASSDNWPLSQAEKIARIKAHKKLISLLEN